MRYYHQKLSMGGALKFENHDLVLMLLSSILEAKSYICYVRLSDKFQSWLRRGKENPKKWKFLFTVAVHL